MGSNHGEKGTETTYFLEVERVLDEVKSQIRLQRDQRKLTRWRWKWSEMGLNNGCDCKGAGMTYSLEIEGARWGQTTDVTTKGSGTTWRESTMGSNHRCDCKGSRADVQTGDGGSTMGSNHRCDGKGRGDDVLTGYGEGAWWGQIMDVAAKGVGVTYLLEVEKEHGGVKSLWDDVLPGGAKRARWGQITDAGPNNPRCAQN
jgi:hypothetical protein